VFFRFRAAALDNFESPLMRQESTGSSQAAACGARTG
jgi:hypothetical protein